MADWADRRLWVEQSVGGQPGWLAQSKQTLNGFVRLSAIAIRKRSWVEELLSEAQSVELAQLRRSRPRIACPHSHRKPHKRASAGTPRKCGSDARLRRCQACNAMRRAAASSTWRRRACAALVRRRRTGDTALRASAALTRRGAKNEGAACASIGD